MGKGKTGVMLFILLLASAALPLHAEEKPKLGKDDFVTTSINAVFDKLNQYTSGEKKIVDWDEMGAGKEKGTDEGADEEKMPGITIRGTTSPTGKEKAAKSE